MGKVTRTVWKCNVCEYEWIPRVDEKNPEQCPNRKCRSRRWDDEKVQSVRVQSGERESGGRGDSGGVEVNERSSDTAQPESGAMGGSVREDRKDTAKAKQGRVMPEGMSNSETQRWLREQRAKEEDVPF